MQIIAKSALATLFLSTLVLAQEPVNGTKEETTGKQGDAKPYHENPPNKAYWADFSLTKLAGGFKFFPDDSKGVRVEVHLQKLPAELGPWTYHVHDQPVPADGNCTGTKAHLDPFIRGQKPECDSKRAASCEVGDLSGKHGAISADIKNGKSFSFPMHIHNVLIENLQVPTSTPTTITTLPFKRDRAPTSETAQLLSILPMESVMLAQTSLSSHLTSMMALDPDSPLATGGAVLVLPLV